MLYSTKNDNSQKIYDFIAIMLKIGKLGIKKGFVNHTVTSSIQHNTFVPNCPKIFDTGAVTDNNKSNLITHS